MSGNVSDRVAEELILYGNKGTTSMLYLPQRFVLCQLRHNFEFSDPLGPSDNGVVAKWRPKERIKTEMVALVLCLNITCDPPDVIKISPCARIQSWIDPFALAPQKALEAIGQALSLQYERWQPRARYKYAIDPTVEEVKKLCNGSRKFAKTERVLFHYNGHGVPRPTANGEIWLFNRVYTQYVPLRISELDSWLKSPSVYVFDCSAAGNIVNAFIELIAASTSSGAVKDCILLAACESHETLPQSAEFPADLFTSCLTTPIQMALRWFWKRSLLRDSVDYSLLDRIPGRPNDRKTLLGELNWIFAAVTDTIAWNVLPNDLFQRLFRQDLLVASLFRNFLLAERIMRSANCSPISHPMLPPTHQHHMWDAWDMAVEFCLSQLTSLIHDQTAEYQPSSFFSEQLIAFEVWLDHGSEKNRAPEQLPIVLRVLLSQCHRHQALVLLGRYLDMGTWAVEQAVSVGIFPYVLKLLQTTAPELRGILVFIWAKILALDKSCQVDLLKDGGHAYFIKCLNSSEEGTYPEQRAMASFVLAVIVDGHKRGQEACVEAGLVEVCLKYLQVLSPGDAQSEPLFLQWLCLCLGKLWKDFTKAQILGIQAGATNVISSLLMGSHPEVRASAVFALGTLVDIGFETLEDGSDEGFDDDEKLKAEISIMKSLLSVVSDGSPLVRAEVAVALARFSCGHNRHLKPLAATYLRSQPSSELSGLHVNITGSAYSTSKHYISPGTIVTSQIGPRFRVSGDSFPAISDGKTHASSPLAMGGILHGSPLSDDSSHHYDPGNGMVNHAMPRPVDNALYLECIYAMCTLAKDPSPQISGLGRKVLSIIGIEQVVARPTKHSSNSSVRPIKSAESSGVRLSGLVRSLSWFDMNSGHLPLTFRTPPVSPPRSDYLSGIRRVSSLELRPNLLIPPDSGLADQPLDNGGSSSHSEHSLLPQSTIYKWSCGNFSKSLITSSDESEELSARREAKEKSALNLIAKSRHHSVGKLHCDVASWDSKFESGTKATLLQPFCPALIAADESERIRVWNCDNHALLNSFDNQEFPNKGTPKLCFLNELDDCLLLVASGNGNVRIWKDYIHKPKLVTAFCSITVHGRSTENVNVAVDWQQQSGYLFVSGYIPSIKVWDLNKEQLLHSISSDDCSTTALAASQVHESQFAAGFIDGSVRLFDIRTPDMLVCETRPHTEGVVGIGFQPGFDPAKIISASQAGDIQFLDFRNQRESCLTIINRDPPLTTFAVHRHAPVVASGSKGRVRLFSLEGDLLGQIKYHLTMFGTNIGLVSCLAFHPYQVKLAAGATDPLLTVYNACQ